MTKVRLTSFSKEEIQKVVSESFDKTEVAVKLGYKLSSVNGQTLRKVQLLIEKFNIATDHFDPSKKTKARRIYPIVEKKCPTCGQKFDTQIGNKEERKTCSYKCANVLFSFQKHGLEQREKVSRAMLKRVADGLHHGWPSRKNMAPSGPESITIEILSELEFVLERELKVGKWFIDFADVDRKIAIEIDGSQHEEVGRKIKDGIKDAYLISQGWQVHRIKWQKLTKEFRQEVKDRLEKILKSG